MKDDEANGLEPLEDDAYVIDADALEAESGSSAADPAATGSDALRKENEELKSQYLRKLADFDNFRKRADREKADYFRHALGGIITEILPVVDNFERALASGTGSGDDLRKGVELIHKQLSEVLAKAGVRAVDEAPVPFDPSLHEAVLREENADVPSHTVVDILQKGYFLHDRLIRPAMVKVAVGGPEKSSENASS